MLLVPLPFQRWQARLASQPLQPSQRLQPSQPLQLSQVARHHGPTQPIA